MSELINLMYFYGRIRAIRNIALRRTITRVCGKIYMENKMHYVHNYEPKSHNP